MDWAKMVIHMALGVLSQVIKNPHSKELLKADLLTLRDDINVLYPGA